MNAIEWTDPPLTKRRGTPGRMGQFVEALKGRPREWAKYPAAVSSAAAAQAKRRYPGIELTTRKRDDGKYDVYARWVGERAS